MDSEAPETAGPLHGHAKLRSSIVELDLGRNHKDPDQRPGHSVVQVMGQPGTASSQVQNRVYIVSPRHRRRSWQMLASTLLSLVILSLWTLAAGRSRAWTMTYIVRPVVALVVAWVYTRWQAGRAIVAEKLTIVRDVGFQSESVLHNGSSTHHLFLPMASIRSIFIHEVMSRWRFKFVLAVALSDADRPIQLLFDTQELRLWQLQALYNDIMDSFQLDQIGQVPVDS
ncbi:hypothetical protein BCR44DRAFT_56635 [Catenaria anguillulae PL171]|uniref:Phosphatidylinositol N-acetylglucosaminyltransferase subunit H conserved domain-containing protein n=1 Tax=Catenaria anguillulae PL171 TaxID=765915 RepID=A0A1Y2HTR2_9FUNG|nr:hypothetical protein BCR44DRAFT_56635 [Catenaria anguillulae PL171]